MRLLFGLCVLIACVATTGCGGPGALTRGTTQDIVLRTDPPAASCTLARDGAVVATVESTPGAVTIERRGAAIEVSCIKAGYFEQRETFVSEWAGIVEEDEGVQAKPAPVATAIGVAATASTQAASYGAAMIGAGGYAAAVVSPVVVVAGLFALPAYGLYQFTANPPFAFRRLPEFVLTPVVFESESERDAYFTRRIVELEAAASGERTRARTGQTCGGAYCNYLLAKVNAGLKLRLDRLAVERSRARVITRGEPGANSAPKFPDSG